MAPFVSLSVHELFQIGELDKVGFGGGRAGVWEGVAKMWYLTSSPRKHCLAQLVPEPENPTVERFFAVNILSS